MIPWARDVGRAPPWSSVPYGVGWSHFGGIQLMGPKWIHSYAWLSQELLEDWIQLCSSPSLGISGPLYSRTAYREIQDSKGKYSKIQKVEPLVT